MAGSPPNSKSPSSAGATASSRLLIILFAAAIVAIAGTELNKRYISKQQVKSESKDRSGRGILKQFEGGTDFNKASLNPAYVKKLSEERGFNEADDSKPNKDGARNRVAKFRSSWDKIINWLSE